MSDQVEKDTTPSGDSQDRVGDILRKERITRRITVETIAKDLKLNVKYIKALEASDFNSLPADPYVRVYLRSLAKYLSLDSDYVLSEFYKERGIEQKHIKGDSSNKLEISMRKQEPKKSPTLVIILMLILLLGVFAFMANQKGWLAEGESEKEEPVKEATADSLITEDSLVASLVTPVSDSMTQSDTVETAQEESEDESEAQKAEEKTVPMNLQLQIVKDSAWIQVYSDGDSWKNILRKGQVRNFTAKDSFNIKLGNGEAASLKLDGEPVEINRRGVAVFKLDRSGADIWTQSKWNDVFKGRQ
ncbi:MAG: helix-turn-helix domain-containing protein [Chitinispirillaceae bacterium]